MAMFFNMEMMMLTLETKAISKYRDLQSSAMYSTKFKDNESFTDSIIGFSLLDINHRRVINNNTLKGR